MAPFWAGLSCLPGQVCKNEMTRLCGEVRRRSRLVTLLHRKEGEKDYKRSQVMLVMGLSDGLSSGPVGVDV